MILVNDGGIWKEVGGGSLGLTLGAPLGGGFLYGSGFIEQEAHALIIADKSAETSLQWKTSRSSTSGTSGTTDGWANTNAMNNSSHPAAQHCRAYRGGGFDDWYLPASDELNLFWLHLAPGTASTPASFKTGGAQALTVPTYYWSSTEGSAAVARGQRFSDGNQLTSYKDDTTRLVRPVRRLKL